MENKLSEFYLELGEKLVSMIPTDWEKIYYLGEVEKSRLSWSSVFYFEESNTNKFIRSHSIPDIYGVSEKIYNQLLRELDEVMLKIYDCFVDEKQEAWDQISLSIDNKGRFNIEYLYNKIVNGTSQVSREVVWAYETFNLIPKEGSFRRKILDKYLNEQIK